VGREVPKSRRAKRRQPLAGLVSLRVERLLGQEKGWGRIGGIWRRSGRGLASHQLVVDIGAELVELHRRESQQLVAGLVGLLSGAWVACVEEGPEGDVVFVQYGVVDIGAGAVAVALASSRVHVGADAG